MMKSTFFYTWLLFLLSFTALKAQEIDPCHTESANKGIPKQYLPGGALFEKRLLSMTEERANQRTEETNATYRIPVVVHVIHNGEAIGTGTNISYQQIQSQIQVLNEDYNRQNADTIYLQSQFKPVAGKISIEFVLANFDPEGTPITSEPGVQRVRGSRSAWTSDKTFDAEVKPSTIWDTKRYLNIWVAQFTGGLLGYAVFPTLSTLGGLPNEISPENRDGVVISYDVFGSYTKFPAPQLIKKAFDRGRTATHEIGHFFGLLHTWGDGGCSVDDFCTDTPNAGGKIFGCKKGSISCTEIDMSENYMTYSNDSCMNIFTKQQVERMKAVLANSPRRKELLASTAADPIDQNIYARFKADRKNVCAGQSVKFTENSVILGGASVRSRTWTFEGGTPSTSTEQFPEVRYDVAGTYRVSLTVRDVIDESTLTKEGFITVQNPSATANIHFKNFEDNILTSGNWLASEGWAMGNYSALDTGRYAAMFDNYTQNLNKQSRRLRSPYLLTGDADFIEISFDVAYSLRSNGSTDSLKISYSTDCGGTENEIWKKGGSDLSTQNGDTPFRPRGSDWRRERAFIDVRNDKNGKIVFNFDNIGGYGNMLYLDNVFIRKVNINKAPTANFAADFTLALPNEKVNFYDLSSNDQAAHQWTFDGANQSTSVGINPIVSYAIEGNFEVSLTVSNPKGSNTARKSNYITVVKARKFTNVSNDLRVPQDAQGFVTGTNTRGDKGKAERFNINPIDKFYAVDVQFSTLEALQANAELTFKVWTGAEPTNLLTTKKVLVSDLLRSMNHGKTPRIVWDSPLSISGSFFVSVEWNNDVRLAIFASSPINNSAWELTAAGKWLPMDATSANGGRAQNFALAIAPIITPEDGNPTANEEDWLATQIKIYPNPASEQVFVQAENVLMHEITLVDNLGRICKVLTVENQNAVLQIENLPLGIYLMRITTNEGVLTKKIVVVR